METSPKHLYYHHFAKCLAKFSTQDIYLEYSKVFTTVGHEASNMIYFQNFHSISTVSPPWKWNISVLDKTNLSLQE